MKGYTKYQSPWLLVILLVLGGIFGSLVGQALGTIPALKVFRQVYSIGLPVTSLNLEVISFTIGFTFKANLVSLFGFIAAFMIYRHL